MKIRKGGILFFDSGIGGLTVLQETLMCFSNQVFFYYGDNDHAPYGNLSALEIQRRVNAVFREMENYEITLAVLACNTATAICAEELRARYTYPIVGAEPAIVPAMKGGGEVLVLATKATCESTRFRLLCEKGQKEYPNAVLELFACEGLAGEIENSVEKGEWNISSYLPPKRPNSVVLGCTHYVYAKKEIEDFYGCSVWDGNAGIAKRVHSIMQSKTTQNHFYRDEQPLKTPTFASECARTDFLLKNGKNKQVFYENQAKEDCFIDEKNNRIFFLGTQKNRNKHIFEQMFANIRK